MTISRNVTETVMAQLKRIVAEELDVNLDAQEIDETVSLLEEGIGLDSMAVMDFILSIEEHFGFEFLESELSVELFDSLNALAGLIAAKLDRSGTDGDGPG